MKKHKHESVYSIDMYAYSSGLRKLNSTYKVLFSFLILVLCIAFNNIYVSLFVSLTSSYVTIHYGKVRFHEYLHLLKIPIAFMIMSSIAIAIGISSNPDGQFNLNLKIFYIYFSYESVFTAISIMLKAFGAICSMYMMTLSTNIGEIISVLKKAHLPNIIIDLMNMIYRFIFILIDVQCKMKNSAQSRLGYLDFKTSCYTFGNIAKNLLLVSMKKSNEYYNAMESRCYDGEMNFLEEQKTIKFKHIIYAVLYVVIIFIIWIFAR